MQEAWRMLHRLLPKSGNFQTLLVESLFYKTGMVGVLGPRVANTAPVDAQENAESPDDPAIRVGGHWSLAYDLGDLQF